MNVWYTDDTVRESFGTQIDSRRVSRMASFENTDDSVVLAAHALLNGEQTEGTFGLRMVEPADRSDFVYRVDPDADTTEIDAEDVTAQGEFPDAEAVMWRADRDRIEQELDRRDIHPG
jgi:hypothetical protein